MARGIIIVDKPAGWTSQDVVSKLRGVFHEKRIGHGGTLDPMATGVLPVFVGRATRCVEFFEHADKAYEATLRLGTVTDTQDVTGTVLETRPVAVTREQLARIMMMYADYIARKNPSASVGLNDYPDHGSVAGWAEPSVKWAVAMGLISGKPQGGKNYLDPQGTASRAEFASILMRFIKAFDGDRAFYASNLDWFCVFIPEMWNGHIQAQHTMTSFGECISFYLKDQAEAVPGTGRLFSLYFCPVENGPAYMELPHWQYLGAMQETENPSKQHFHVFLDLPTDVQMGMTDDPMLDQILIKLYNSIYEQKDSALTIYGLQGLEFNAGVG